MFRLNELQWTLGKEFRFKEEDFKKPRRGREQRKSLMFCNSRFFQRPQRLLRKNFDNTNPNQRRDTMKSSTKDQAEGKFHEAKGKVKEMAGKITDNPKLKAEGKDEKIAGKVQKKIGQVEKVLGK
jgi:uncharacterized protein YjbJ (UPF0337 family)